MHEAQDADRSETSLSALGSDELLVARVVPKGLEIKVGVKPDAHRPVPLGPREGDGSEDPEFER